MPNDQYFSLRNVTPDTYADFTVPSYLKAVLPPKDARILDFGCGFGQLLRSLDRMGYQNLVGADINAQALAHLRKVGIEAIDSSDYASLCAMHAGKFDFIVMSHVLEHLPKDHMVQMLTGIREMLAPGGRLLVMAPNAQSSTGCYWAYEDFTHTTIFTAGSLTYVLRAAGFSGVVFTDVDCTAGLGVFGRVVRKSLLWLYRSKQRIWNVGTGSAFHAPSPEIYSYELKALATR